MLRPRILSDAVADAARNAGETLQGTAADYVQMFACADGGLRR